MNASADAATVSRFGTLQDEALACCMYEIPLPQEFTSACSRDVVLRARFGRTVRGGELRSVHILGPRIEIINVFHFPSAETAHPLYAMEFVLFGRKPVVGVMDCSPLAGDAHSRSVWEEVMRSAHARHPDLRDAGDPPGWYSECRSGLDFFTRPAGDAQLDALVACHGELWRSLADLEKNAPSLLPDEIQAHARALTRYKDHHRENSPGLPFLHRTFGAAWTDTFMRQALFA